MPQPAVNPLSEATKTSSAAPLPMLFVQRLERLLPSPEVFEAVIESFARPTAVGFRVNSLKANTDEVLAELASLGLECQRVAWSSTAFSVRPSDRAALLASEAWQRRRIYVQNLSSQLPPVELAPVAGGLVLDLAAAPGSKTSQIAAMTANQAEIIAVEKVKNRFFKLRANLEEQGAQAHTVLADGGQFWRRNKERFDRVLIDAPCSTEAQFRSGQPDSFSHWSERKIAEQSRKQKQLLYSAVQALKPGGTLLYSTCSFAPEENEAVLHQALKKFGDAVAVQPLQVELDNAMPGLLQWGNKRFNPQVQNSRRILPNGLMEGFYICKLVKLHSTIER